MEVCPFTLSEQVPVCGYTFKGSNSYFYFCLLSHGSAQKRIFSPKSKFFPFRVDPILKGLHCPGKQTGSYKSCFICKNDRKSWRCTRTYFNLMFDYVLKIAGYLANS